MNSHSYIYSTAVSSQVSGCSSTSTTTSTQMNPQAESQPAELHRRMQVISESNDAVYEETEEELKELNNHNDGIFYFYSTTYDYI